MKIELKDIPKKSKIRVHLLTGKEDILIFYHLDGLYSYCELSDGTVQHLRWDTPLELGKDGIYKIKE